MYGANTFIGNIYTNEDKIIAPKKSEDKATTQLTQGRKEIIFLLKIVFVWSKCQTSFECKS